MSQVDNPIQITHYINPHRFYYKPETAYMQEHEQVKFATAFNEYCENEYGIIFETVRNTPSWKHPKPGDLVALRSNQLQRWIRCEMEDVMVDVNETTWYYLWAIDEGLPIKTLTTYVRPLPQAFGQEPAHAKRGAMINILPGETQYDYMEDKPRLVPSIKWSCGIVSTLELMLESAESISFFPTTQYVLQNETIHVGELFITTQSNITHNVGKKLREACPNQLMFTTKDATYFKGIVYLGALYKQRYVNNEGFDNHVVNNFVTKISRYDPTSPQYMDTQTDTKVYEWLKQNQEARIAILAQQKAAKDENNEASPIQQTTIPAKNNLATASALKKCLERAKYEIDKKDATTNMTDLSIQKRDDSEHAAVSNSKRSNLMQKIKRQQVVRQMSNTGCASSSNTSE
ncbi:uncharacterized protein LOC128709428 [Anopheles marshallii]|uniref:uncharacterized protein LOC128709428 n=1 Tax=Anopheles marshallii TaxID=1521116 RepID=UPI00237AB7F9|nr:uncharacterized protein LOC128709428 [Anopheles marshallii]